MSAAVDQLRGGSAKPGDLPLVTLDGFEPDINPGAAQAQGITVVEAMKSRAARIFR